MTLTTNGQNYIATKFGNTSKCFIASGLNYTYLGTDNVTYTESGGTAQIVSRLVMTSLVQSLTISGVTYTYALLKTNNDNTDVLLTDAQWIAANDGTPSGEPQYCVPAPTTGSILCTTTPSGASVSLDGTGQGVVTPVTLTDVSTGSHTVTFTMSGYNSCPVTVTVTAGSTVTASCTLTAITTNLTANGKNYIATKFGNTSKCFIASGLNYTYLGTDNITYTESGGTAQVVSRLVMTSLVQSLTLSGITYTYALLKTNNDNTDVLLTDAQWIAANDGTPSGEPQYCAPAETTGSISCVTTPSGASVALDGTGQGVVTPVTLTNVSAGSHTVTFTMSGYNSCPVTVTVTAGSTVTASCTLVPVVTTGNISCTTTPSGSNILLDGLYQSGAITPVTLTNVSTGFHTVTFRLSGYNDCPQPVIVTAGQTVTASCTLQPIVTAGSILCTTVPSGALVLLDGILQSGAITPITLANVSAGTHTVTFKLSGYNDCPQTVIVTAGQTATASCTFACNTPSCAIVLMQN